jgi:superfamily II DNA/RNA helicase
MNMPIWLRNWTRTLPNNMETFNSLGLLPAFTEKLKERSITAPTGIQRLVIPLLLAGKSVIFRSATGTGKTFAYLLPALQRLLSDTESVDKNPRYPGPALLICAPTLELCSQIKAEADLLSPFPAALLIGSVKIDRQIETLKKNKPLTAVGNPGRLLLLAKMGKLKFQNLRFLVLDEADRLTSEEILGQTREMLSLIERDTRRLNVKDDGEFSGGLCIAACSATVTGKTGVLLGPLFDSAEIIESDEHEILRERIEHWALFSESRKKVQTLRSLLAALKTAKPRFKALVFTSRNEEAGKILSALQFHHIPATGLFGKMDRGGAKKQISRKPASRDRKAALDLFRQGSINVLVSTDLAARGLDISGLTHIIAMDVSADREIYIHRAGRTGRAGRRGVMISIGDEFELRRLASLEKKLAIMVRPKELYMGRICDPTE